MGILSDFAFDMTSIRKKLYYLYLHIFTHRIFHILISFIYPLYVAIKSFEFQSTGNKPDFWISFGLISAIFLLIEIFIALANNIKRKHHKQLSLTNRSLEGQALVSSWMANKLYDLSKQTKEHILQFRRLPIDFFKEIIDFQKIAMFVCKDIYDMINEKLCCKDCEVTVFQQFEEDNKRYVKMVAYANRLMNIPASYTTKYNIHNRNKEKTKPYLVKIFEKGEAKPHILENREMVQKAFKYFEGSQFREETICQYIGLPIRCNSNIIAFILQVDVSEEGILGKDINEINQFAYNVLSPYGQLLNVFYEQENVFEIFYSLVANIHFKEEEK